MEERGWVEAEWGLSDRGKRAKFYRMTAAGRRQLRVEASAWEKYAAAVAKLLGAATLPA
jgi:DNA-binding PadR family transcriptional regulator